VHPTLDLLTIVRRFWHVPPSINTGETPMDITALTLVGCISGAFFVFTLYSWLGRKLLWLAGGADVIITIMVPILFAGTGSGIITALAFGVTFTIVIRIMSMLIPSEEIAFRKHRGLPQAYWKTVPPKKFEVPQFKRRY
jgi:hypothetical protein